MAATRTYSITLASLLSFPLRICNPPPAVGKVRSCGVTPLLSVALDDILDRQHLPPLGLKDFEEWLLFVEICPENLYFILWLREYKQRYSQWQSQAAFNRSVDPSPAPTQPQSPAHYSSHLAIFYLRAKQTFLTPGSAYELNLDSALLAPLHRPGSAPYPPPSALRPIESEVRAALDASLRRFVAAQLNNVGSRRVLCGILAGIAFCLLGACVPLALVFAARAHRWTRLAALPGLWLGLTVLLASVNGICLGVYIFGDLRQLRRFELARPRISKPVPLPAFAPIARLAAPAPAPAHPTSATHAQQPADIAHSTPAVLAERAESACGSSEEDGIHISPAYYDAEAAAEDDHSELYRAPWDAEADHYGDGGGGGGADGWKTEAWREEVDYGAEYGLDLSPLGDASSGYSCSRSRTPSRASSRGAREREEGERDVPNSPRSVGSASSLGGASEASGESIGGMTVFSGTATFIHVFDPAPGAGSALPAGGSAAVEAALQHGGMGGSTDEIDTEAVLARAMRAPASHQRVAPFDFEGLPVKKLARLEEQQQRRLGHGEDNNTNNITKNTTNNGHYNSNNNTDTTKLNRNKDDEMKMKMKRQKKMKRGISLPPLSIPNPLSRPAIPLSRPALPPLSIPQRAAPAPSHSHTYSHTHNTHAHTYSHSHNTHAHAHTDSRATHRAPRPPSPAYAARPRGWRGALGRMQERCGLARWRLQVGYLEDVKYLGVGVGRGGWKEEVEAASPKPHWSSPYWEAVGREKDGRCESREGDVYGQGYSERYSERERRGWAGWAPRGSWGRKSADSEKTRYVGEDDDDDGDDDRDHGQDQEEGDEEEEEGGVGGWGVDVEKGVKGGKRVQRHRHRRLESRYSRYSQHEIGRNGHGHGYQGHGLGRAQSGPGTPVSAAKGQARHYVQRSGDNHHNHSLSHNDNLNLNGAHNEKANEKGIEKTSANDEKENDEKETRFRRRLRAMWSVPAFAVPLARVLSPVVVRGQWEIVVRSAAYAAVVAVCVIAGVVVVPV